MTITGVEKKDSLGEFSNAPEGSEYVIANVEFENVGEKIFLTITCTFYAK